MKAFLKRHRFATVVAGFVLLPFLLVTLRLLVVLVGTLLTFDPKTPLAEKKLVEFGWDEPTTAFLRQHISQMEQSPFDGCVFKLEGFEWVCWGRRAFSETEFQPQIEDLKATQFHRFTENFMRFDVTPGDVDWFDDFSAIISNARLAGKIVHDAGCRGILFDVEQYNTNLFDYHRLQHREGRTWEEYVRQANRRGREVMEAFQADYPDITIFTTFAYCLPWLQTYLGFNPLRNGNYGLLAPFLDGMVAAAGPQVTLVDGCEHAYFFKYPSLFRLARYVMRSDLLYIVQDRRKYHQLLSVGFGLWMDYKSGTRGWNTEDFTRNYYTPAAFEASLHRALEASDKYVWVYTERAAWWSPQGGSVAIPQPYADAIRRSREDK